MSKYIANGEGRAYIDRDGYLIVYLTWYHCRFGTSDTVNCKKDYQYIVEDQYRIIP